MSAAGLVASGTFLLYMGVVALGVWATNKWVLPQEAVKFEMRPALAAYMVTFLILYLVRG